MSGQVSTDKIDKTIDLLLTEAESYREREARLAGDSRSGDMAAHFAMRERSFAVNVLEGLLKDASNTEVPQEAREGTSEASEVRDLLRSISEYWGSEEGFREAARSLRKYLGVEPTREQQEHVAKRTARAARFAEEAAKANRAREQKEEQVMEAYEIVGETDAYKWAEYWLQVFHEHPEIAEDRDVMMGWFANAIMAGFDSHSSARPEHIVHVKVGGDMGDGMPPFVPGPKELAEERARWQVALGPKYLVICTHHMTEADFWVAPDGG